VETGAQLTPSLELVREIGRGAMGSVWQARNTALGTSVAVKVLRPDTVFTEDGEARFEREIEVLAALDHPHLVRIVDRGKTPDGQPFFVMEFLRGEDLGKRLDREGSLGVEDTVTIVSQACRGLAVAHERGIVHRDLKPANLFLLDDAGRPFVKVLDFGIAKRASELAMTSTGISVGTPYFMSPEQFFTPSKADHRTDLWALAVVAYVCLSGALPFVGETPSAIGLAAMQQTFTPITKLRPELGPNWDAFFAQALHPEPARRHASAHALAEALRQVAEVPRPSTGGHSVEPGALAALALAPTDVVATLPAQESGSIAEQGPAPEVRPEPARAEPAKASLGNVDTDAVGTTDRVLAEAATSVVAPALAARRRSRTWAFGAAALAATIGVGALLVARDRPPRPGVVSATEHESRPPESPLPPSPTTAQPSAPPSAPSAPSPSAFALPPDASSPLVKTSADALPSAARTVSKPTSTGAVGTAPGAVAAADDESTSRPFPHHTATACWRDNEGATSTVVAGSHIEVDVEENGKVSSVRVQVPNNQFPAYRTCVVTRFSQTPFRVGARETLRGYVPLGPMRKKAAPP
jgi:serine/threonine-protein kinase